MYLHIYLHYDDDDDEDVNAINESQTLIHITSQLQQMRMRSGEVICIFK